MFYKNLMSRIVYCFANFLQLNIFNIITIKIPKNFMERLLNIILRGNCLQIGALVSSIRTQLRVRLD